MDTFDANTKHKTIELSNNGLTATKLSVWGFCEPRNVYGSIGIDSKDQRIYRWTITVTKRAWGEPLFIGIASTRDIHGHYKDIHYGYSAKTGVKCKLGSFDGYGFSIQSGGSLMMNVDFQRKEVSFVVDGKDLGVAFTDIEIGPRYYLCASIYKGGDILTISNFECAE